MEETPKWKEFLTHLELLTYTTKFKFIGAAPKETQEAGHKVVQESETLLAVYENEPDSVCDCIWVTDKSFYWNSKEGVVYLPFASIKIDLTFDDILDAEKNPDLRAVLVTLPNGQVIKMPVLGITDGELDAIRVKRLVFLACDAMGLVKAVNKE